MDGNVLGTEGRTTRRRARIITAVGVGVLGLIVIPGTASAETISDSASASVNLDTSSSGTLAAFDPALGTLTQVDWSASTNATTQLCIENLSTEARSTTGFVMTADLTVAFPSGATTSASINQTIADVTLEASNGSDDCLAGLDAGTDRFPSAVSAPDVLFTPANNAGSNGATITDPAALAEFIGPGTVPFSFTSASNADVAQPSEWDIIFSAFGDYSLNITYTYTPTAPPTTTTTTTTTTPGPTTPGATTTPSSSIAVTTPPPAPTTTPPQLPATGTSESGVIVAGSVAIGAGLLLVVIGGRRIVTR